MTKIKIGRFSFTINQIVLFLVLLMISAFYISPFVWVFNASIRNYSEATSLPPKWIFPRPSQWDMKYIKILFAPQSRFFIWMRNSLFMSSLITIGMVTHAAIAGYAYARLQFRGKNIMFSLLLVSMMVPIQVTVVPLYRIMTFLQLVNTHWGVTLPAIFGAMCPGLAGGFGIFMLRQIYTTIPIELEEAAIIDGASPACTFFRIVLPMVKASLASLAIISFTFSWNDYFSTFIMINSPKKLTLPVGILQLRQPFATGDNVVFAAITLSILPVLIVFLFFQKWIVKSLSCIGIKG